MKSSSMPPRILIVDDELAHMRALCDTLRGQAYDTTGLVSGEAALSLLAVESFDLLLVDLMMPGMNGIAVVEAARQIDPDLACIIMTGEGTIASAVQAMQAGALDYVVKPFKVSGILLILARALETRQLRIANARLELLPAPAHGRTRRHEQGFAAGPRSGRAGEPGKDQFPVQHEPRAAHARSTPSWAFPQMLMSDSIPSTAQEKENLCFAHLRRGPAPVDFDQRYPRYRQDRVGQYVAVDGTRRPGRHLPRMLANDGTAGAQARHHPDVRGSGRPCMCWPTVRASSRYCSTCCRTPSSTTGNRAKSTSIASPSIRGSCACPCAIRAAG